jgi:hypothetical protein|tara:strand:+ start:112 stop:561 length:450 start_codon:yes stop_codon:yes gene_type:complete
MNIQDLETKYKELGAEIERLKQQPEGVWEPSLGGIFWMVDWGGGVRRLNPNNRAAVSHYNVYKTEALAKKASVLQRRSNLVIQACLNFDPDFVPDWSDEDQAKYGFFFTSRLGLWVYSATQYADDSPAYVSTREIASKVVAYLNSQEIK